MLEHQHNKVQEQNTSKTMSKDDINTYNMHTTFPIDNTKKTTKLAICLKLEH